MIIPKNLLISGIFLIFKKQIYKNHVEIDAENSSPPSCHCAARSNQRTSKKFAPILTGFFNLLGIKKPLNIFIG